MIPHLHLNFFVIDVIILNLNAIKWQIIHQLLEGRLFVRIIDANKYLSR